MKHTFRQHGQLVQIDCELGSGIVDKNGREIFEGDIVKCDDGERMRVQFVSGAFILTKGDEAFFYGDGLEVVGHAEV